MGNTFTPTRGIRQGDPLSPYLFLIVSEVLSLMIKKACEANYLQGLKFGRSGPTLSHLLFADDALFFIRGNTQNCRHMRLLLDGYCRAFGQQINFGKSSLFFSPNTPASISTQLGAILGMTMVDDPGKYLGLPTMWGRSKKEALQFVKEKLLRKLSRWKQSLLSQAGREVLIKAVAQAVPNYPMGVFLFPKRSVRRWSLRLPISSGAKNRRKGRSIGYVGPNWACQSMKGYGLP
ncbi:Ribonuclease H-like superfamily protein [Prunus dulcis]|uniref:Ribonuclease H-like superfamily protein n=2 Tax=Prunus dulcis TaxID=3755 RepID=A0A4Y1RHJ3_PRUDU|nr:Ribonuclease H-like superfamily protein [Prunus dulcis]